MEVIVLHNGDDISQRNTIVSLLHLRAHLLKNIKKVNGLRFTLYRLEDNYCQFNLSGDEIAIITTIPLKNNAKNIVEMIYENDPEIVICSKEMFKYLNENSSDSRIKYVDCTIDMNVSDADNEAIFVKEFIKSVFNYLSSSRNIYIPEEIRQYNG